MMQHLAYMAGDEKVRVSLQEKKQAPALIPVQAGEEFGTENTVHGSTS
jgi:hypothetical protein